MFNIGRKFFNGDFTDLERSAFSSYDPESDFDPDFDGFKGRKQKPVQVVEKQKAYFDLVMTNPEGGAVTVELFNAFRSFTKLQRGDLSSDVNTYSYLPLNSREGMEALINNIVPAVNRTPANESYTGSAGFVGFDKTGALIITKSGALAATTKVVCSQFPYNGLLQSSSEQPFRITRIRMTTTTDAQISNPIVTFKNSFLGSKEQNEINPRNYFNPNQFQNKIIDIPMNFGVNGQSGLLYTLNNGETVQWNVEIESYRLNKV